MSTSKYTITPLIPQRYLANSKPSLEMKLDRIKKILTVCYICLNNILIPNKIFVYFIRFMSPSFLVKIF